MTRTRREASEILYAIQDDKWDKDAEWMADGIIVDDVQVLTLGVED